MTALAIGLVLVTAAVVGVVAVAISPLPRRWSASPASRSRRETFARMRLTKAALEHLDLVAESEAAPRHVVEQLRQSWQARAARVQADDSMDSTGYRALRRELLAVEGAELNRLFEAGKITDATRGRIQRVLDLEQAGLGEDEL